MRYEFKMPPQDAKSLPAYLQQEFFKVAQAISSPSERIGLVPLGAAPVKPRDGEVIYTSGIWDPGAGAGFYGRHAGAWVKLS